MTVQRDSRTETLGELDAALIAAHDARDAERLVTLYAVAADRVSGRARAFFLTQAYVIALEKGDPRAAALRSRLVSEGAETERP